MSIIKKKIRYSSLTDKEKLFLSHLLNKDYTLTALDGFYSDDDEKTFKEYNYGFSFKKAEKTLMKLIDILNQD